MTQKYDALLVLSFGGPEGMDDVMPFLENVLRGRNVPRERMMEVAHHYEIFGGVSPINNQNRALISALESEMPKHDIDLPIYWGNRNWHPMLQDTVRRMADDNIKRALVFATSGYSSYSGCRQYREDLAVAQNAVGAEVAPQFDKIRVFYNHPDFIYVNAEAVCEALKQISPDRHAQTRIAFTAHSIPQAMSDNCAYRPQLEETCRLVAGEVKRQGFDFRDYKLLYQSRSGAPQTPWLEPDILDYLKELKNAGASDTVIAPVGFISDHLEVLYDLDTEAKALCEQLGLNMIRARTAGTHPRFVSMICELINERVNDSSERRAVGSRPPNHDVCPANCCLSGAPRPPLPAVAHSECASANVTS